MIFFPQVHVHIKRHLMKELPDTDEAVAQWCRDIFVAKVHVERTFLPFYCFFPLTVHILVNVV